MDLLNRKAFTDRESQRPFLAFLKKNIGLKTPRTYSWKAGEKPSLFYAESQIIFMAGHGLAAPWSPGAYTYKTNLPVQPVSAGLPAHPAAPCLRPSRPPAFPFLPDYSLYQCLRPYGHQSYPCSYGGIDEAALRGFIFPP